MTISSTVTCKSKFVVNVLMYFLFHWQNPGAGLHTLPCVCESYTFRLDSRPCLLWVQAQSLLVQSDLFWLFLDADVSPSLLVYLDSSFSWSFSSFVPVVYSTWVPTPMAFISTIPLPVLAAELRSTWTSGAAPSRALPGFWLTVCISYRRWQGLTILQFSLS